VAVSELSAVLVFILDIEMHKMQGLKMNRETYTGNVNGLYSRVTDVTQNLINHPPIISNICTFVFISTRLQENKFRVLNEPSFVAIIVTKTPSFS